MGTTLLVLIICISGIVIINACRKTDRQNYTISKQNEELRFFKEHPSNEPLVQAITRFIKGENSKYNFVEKLVQQLGYPYWDKAITISNKGKIKKGVSINEDSANITYIPFVHDSQNFVNASLLIKTSPSDTVFQFLCDWQYFDYGFDTTSGGWSARDVFHLFSKLDKSVFNRSKFIITDRRIFGSDSSNTIKIEMLADSNSLSARGTLLSPVTICTPYRQCCHCGCLAFRNTSSQSSDGVCCYPEYGTVCTTFWIEDGWNPVNGGGGSGGGTGGGGGWTPPGCGGTAARNELTDNPPCGPGWVPIDDGLAYNPNVYDTIGISNEIRDNFPCLYGLLNDTLINANYIAQLASTNIFNDSSYFNLTFEISTTNTQLGQAKAHTFIPANVAWVDANGNYHFSAKIRLNPYYLENSTKESKISTILHETMHVIIALRWYQYTQGIGGIDSFYLKEHFPIYWSYFTNQEVHPNEEQDHELMGWNYTQLFSAIGQQFFNPSASSAIRDTVLKALSYSGLDNTTAWALLPKIGIDTCKYRTIMLAGQLSLAGTYSWPGCPVFTTHYADSLGMTPPCK